MSLKPIVGYCDPLWAAPGESVRFMISAREDVPYTAQLVRLICGDDRDEGAGFQEEPVPHPINGTYKGRRQALIPGSYADIPAHAALTGLQSFRIEAAIWPTRPGAGPQCILSSLHPETQTGFAVSLDREGHLALQLGNGDGRVTTVSHPLPLAERNWVHISAAFDAADGRVSLDCRPLQSRPWSQPAKAADTSYIDTVSPTAYRPAPHGLRIACVASSATAADRRDHFDGKIDGLTLYDRAAISPEARAVAEWDFSQQIDSRHIVDLSENNLNGTLYNLPTRAVTGHNWDGSVHSWQQQPSHYGAIHFHTDDLYDAGWEADFTLTLPDDMPSGQYAVRLFQELAPGEGCGERNDRGRDDIVFFVRPPRGRATAKIAYLVPTATYLAYANSRLRLQPNPLFGDGQSPYANDNHLRADPAIASSLYERHDDKSGVHFSSWLRPVMNLKPLNRLWSFNADTNVTAWLAQTGEAVDMITDHDLHKEGRDLLAPYRVVITGAHPEYYSSAMRAGLSDYLEGGGRLMYLGGNGFYWRIGFSDAWPAAIEVRRAEDGTRAWIAEPGEYYQAFSGEYGGLWRRIGQSPNQLAGIGFAAQGFDRGTYYERLPAADDPRAAFIFSGIDDTVIGDFGSVVGGASGEEIDRYDPRLGSPPHALVVATATNHSEQMLRTKEEFLSTALPFKDRSVRSDMVFFECANGGAVFSTGSISWASALAHNGYRNNVCKLTENVLNRFANPAPFTLPEH